jgi:hypothetical protein
MRAFVQEFIHDFSPMVLSAGNGDIPVLLNDSGSMLI